MKKLLFGTAGIPITTEEHTTISGIERVKELKLDCMELEFVRSIYLKESKTKEVKKAAEKDNIILTAHAPYYINLNSKDKAKREASKLRIYKTAKIANLCKAYSICFHPGFYLKQNPKKVYYNILHEMQEVITKLKDENIKIWVRPETTGKPTSFGDLNEILKLSQELDQVMPCIDFAHLHARSNGKNNSLKEFKEILSKVESSLGKEGLNNMHIHISGIKYSPKGEQHHLTLKNSDFNYKELCKAFKEFKIKGVVISESPNIESDALLIKKLF